MDHPDVKSLPGRGLLRPSARWRRRATLVLLVGLGMASWYPLILPTAAQADTTATERRILDPPSPRGALWRAAAVPGWGQLYNRQYLKIPVVYAGLAGFATAALLVNRRYLLYRHAFLFIARQENGEPVFPEYADDHARLLADLGLPPEAELSEAEIANRRARLAPQFRAQRDNLRRNRDLLYFGIVFWYGLSMLDAFVSAHLLDFDVGEDLTVTLVPPPASASLKASLRWDF